MPFLTPEAPNADRYILAIVPDSFEPFFYGGLMELLPPENWEQFGSLTVENTLAYTEGIFNSLSDLTQIFSNPVLLFDAGDSPLFDDNGELLYGE